MKVVVSHPSGNRAVRALLTAASASSELCEFHTSFAADASSLKGVYPKALKSWLERRSFSGIDHHRIVEHRIPEAIRQLGLYLSKAGLRLPQAYWMYRKFDAAVARSLDRRSLSFDALICYDGSGLETIKAAKKRGSIAALELSAPYYKFAASILEEERALHPNLATSIPPIFEKSEFGNRRDAELEQSDIVLVASTFALSSLPAHVRERKKVLRIPFGSPQALNGERFRDLSSERLHPPIKVLYVGFVGQQKGISYLLGAKKIVGKAMQLTVVGSIPPSSSGMKAAISGAAIRYIPYLSHPGVLEEMRSSDVFVFPTLCDGFGMVLLEAMSQGLPIIATPNCAAPDLIEDGKTGYIVPIRSAEKIAEKILYLASNIELCREMGLEAIRRAAGRSWGMYGRDVLSQLREATSTGDSP